jgi:hypothetical protein
MSAAARPFDQYANGRREIAKRRANGKIKMTS